MVTSKPISTISYNTELFLNEALIGLYNKQIISDYAYICHKGEEGDKDHIHLYIEPNKKLDTMCLDKHFFEYLPGIDKPLRCTLWRNVKGDSGLCHWLMYVLHDEQYCDIHCPDEPKQYSYTLDDIKCSDTFDKVSVYDQGLCLRVDTSSRSGLISYIEHGATLMDCFVRFTDMSTYDIRNIYSSYANSESAIIDRDRYKAMYRFLCEQVHNAGFDVEVVDGMPMLLCFAPCDDEVPFES